MGQAYVASALAAALLVGAAMAAPAVDAACGKMCAAGKATPAAAKQKARNTLQAEQKSKGNIDDYWSPCNSNKLTDYMYCQP